MTSFKIYHRDAVEKKLIDMAKVKSEGAMELYRRVFQGVPATAVGVVSFSRKSVGLIFLSEFKDEPIPHFRNISGSRSGALLYDALAGALFQMKAVKGQIWTMPTLAVAQRVADSINATDPEVRKLAMRIMSGPTVKDCEKMLIIRKKGLVALSPEHIIGRNENPLIASVMIATMTGGKIPV